MFASIVGNPWWGIVAAAVLVAAFILTYYILLHDPKSRAPLPGHPAYEGDDDEDEE